MLDRLNSSSSSEGYYGGSGGPRWRSTAITLLFAVCCAQVCLAEPNQPAFVVPSEHGRAVVIVCDEMIDDGLYESIRRRSEQALAEGATTIIYEINTFGGLVKSALSIWDYLMHEVNPRAHTVAYVPNKAISAGALISVACEDIVMKKAAILGDCAPIVMGGGELEGTEREKQESPLRSYFMAAAKANNYPPVLCMAMVTIGMEVYQVKNNKTGLYEYFDVDKLPQKSETYDLDNKKLVVSDDELLTVDGDEAYGYGIARALVDSFAEVLTFLEKKQGVSFVQPVERMEVNWSESLVRWLTSPTVSGILIMVAMLGIYAELNSPGLGLPGALAVVALVVLFGSKFLIGMANWWEIAVFLLGLVLLLLEIFVIPGFGVAGVTGALLMIFALAAMMVGNSPDELPIPRLDADMELLGRHLMGMAGGFMGFLIGAYLIARYLPSVPVANKLILAGPQESAQVRRGGLQAGPAPEPAVQLGQEGVAMSQLRPSGVGRFDGKRINVVTRGELIETNSKIKIVAIDGNSIIVKELKGA